MRRNLSTSLLSNRKAANRIPKIFPRTRRVFPRIHLPESDYLSCSLYIAAFVYSPKNKSYYNTEYSFWAARMGKKQINVAHPPLQIYPSQRSWQEQPRASINANKSSDNGAWSWSCKKMSLFKFSRRSHFLILKKPLDSAMLGWACNLECLPALSPISRQVIYKIGGTRVHFHKRHKLKSSCGTDCGAEMRINKSRSSLYTHIKKCPSDEE